MPDLEVLFARDEPVRARTCDFHIDLPWQIVKQDLESVVTASPNHASLEGMDKGGLDVAFMPLYLAPSRWLRAEPQQVWDLYNEQVLRLVMSGELGGRFLLSVENMEPYNKAGLSFNYAEQIKRPKVVGLVHNDTNIYADSATGFRTHRGLSKEGRKLVRDLDSKGILIDVSHASEEVIFQLEDLVTHPIVATHSASARLCPHPRNLSDAALKFIATSGGVVGVPFVEKFLGDKTFGEHVAHIADVMGIRQVGVGSDLDGAKLVPDLDHVEKWRSGVQAHLSTIGMTPDEMDWVMGENILSLFPGI